MRAGLINGARHSGEFDPLGRILVGLGRIGERDLLRSLERMTRCERPQGQLLREMGLLGLREVEQTLRHQLERRMLRLLALGDRVRVASITAVTRGRPVGPCRPLHPYAAIWHHLCALADRDVERQLRRHGDGPHRLRPGARPPLWMAGLDGVALERAARRGFTPSGLPPALRRPALFLHETGLLAPCPPRAASHDEARRAYWRLALELHPDRHPRASEAERADLARRFARATEAYASLTSSRGGDLTAS
jgi:hypothetical protein